jgi:hypothetical protein
MIKYALRCENTHTWDAWFPSISGFDDQQSRGLVDCPYCGTKSVEKAPMAPSIVASRSDRPAPPQAVAPPPETQALSVATNDESFSVTMPEPVKAMLAEMKERIEKTYDYVGDTFAREVRAMHEGETEERLIYGEATLAEVKALVEDDIPVAPLPILASPRRAKGVH